MGAILVRIHADGWTEVGQEADGRAENRRLIFIRQLLTVDLDRLAERAERLAGLFGGGECDAPTSRFPPTLVEL